MRHIKNTYTKNEAISWPVPNYWDALALILVLAVIVLLVLGAGEMVGHYQIGEEIPISLNPDNLPYYALRSVMRILIALACSVIFTFTVGTLAAKNKRAERILIPMIDILQSVPVLGYLSFTVVGFLVLFRGSMLGPECACIFTIFTAQVWNMTLSFYQSLRSVPEDLKEAVMMFHLSAWQKFWRLEVPFAMPGLLWNAMLSMSGSWVYLMLSETITVAHQNITLQGIGSYTALAIAHADKVAIGYAILAMFVVIFLYDQLLFRPLIAWAEKFKAEESASEIVSQSWVLDLFHRAEFFQFIGGYLSWLGDVIVNIKYFRHRKKTILKQVVSFWQKCLGVGWNFILYSAIILAAVVLYHFIFSSIPASQTWHVVFLGLVTATRVLAMIILSSIIWVPVGVWIGLNPRASQIAQPIAQFLAAFPANLLFPVAAILIVRYDLNTNIWTSPLMILGTQWYILFNVIAGTVAIPKNLKMAVDTLGVRGWLWWKRLILPGIFPYYITGVITAAGGAWNISIYSEAVTWGNIQLHAVGLGAYITEVSQQGNFAGLALGITIMSLFVVLVNRCIWRPLYNLAERRYQIR
ncbi:MAG: sulfonate ABC transporter permease [Gammaproteobacteria bacterium CG_4_10_14_0_8_um_filter_38_16]|nr:MAG: sulfonate ABC transporter permease [Gammaproteobacteria bacterium CG_4_10_14_0_8_um_filter_38_16]PJA03832.1 MAG: sulfonate ABC transporter permease [Gammaproteobacteria bacterium CG_4_10_14_0_2_um_filter_38_22]PJB10806.1 MAG: sulfonate ABC transporter permease [Gammaproteobacteria bacterium CG_4_9_14_3_um_filter_38_9]